MVVIVSSVRSVGCAEEYFATCGWSTSEMFSLCKIVVASLIAIIIIINEFCHGVM